MTDESDVRPPNNGQIHQKHGGRLNRGGTKGNKGGGDKPRTYKMWLASLLTSEKHRKEFTKAMEDSSHSAFMKATEHAAAYAEGKPKETVKQDTTLTVRIVSE